MATVSSVLAWKIPWTEEPCGLQSRGLKKSQTRLETKQEQCLAGAGQIISQERKSAEGNWDEESAERGEKKVVKGSVR